MAACDSLASDFMAGKYSSVIKQCTSLLKKLDDSDSWTRRILLDNRATCYLKLGIYRRCIKDAVAAIEIDPFWLRPQFTHIQALVKMKKIPEAKAIYKTWRKTSGSLDLSLQKEIEDYFITEKQAAIDEAEAEKKREIAFKKAERIKKAKEKKEKEEKMAKESKEKREALEKHERSKFAFTKILKQSGHYKKAISEYTLLIEKNPDLVRAYVERGEIYLLLRKFSKAVKDLHNAVLRDQNNVNALMKLSEARTFRAERYVTRGGSSAAEAPAQLDQAISEVSRAIKILRPTTDFNAIFSALRQRALIFRRQGNHEYALSDFQDSIKIMPYHVETMIGMGLSLQDLGRSEDAIKIYKEALTHAKDTNVGLIHNNLGISYETLGEHDEAETSFQTAIREGHKDSQGIRGMYRYMQGHTQKCIEDMNTVDEAVDDEDKQLKLQMRGVAYHSLGQYRYAVKDYAKLLATDPPFPGLITWYRRQMIPVIQTILDKPFTEYNFDLELHRSFKTAAVRTTHPTTVSKSYKPNNGEVDRSISDVNLSRSLSRKQQAIQDGTIRLGYLLQCTSKGFTTNIRQHRMFGLAVIEIAQTIKRHWAQPIQVSGKGASKDRKPHTFGWRDMMDIAVRWRQHSEPNDHVFWIDQVDNDKGEIGMQGPIISGQKKSEQYYAYRDRCFKYMKPFVCDQQRNLSGYDKKLIMESKTEDDLFKLIGHDFWAVAYCASRCSQEKIQSIRLILQQQEPEGYNFCIQIPAKPERDERYDQELTLAFDDLQEYFEGKRDDNDLEKSVELCLTFYFYWVNHGALTKGIGACGMIVLNALLIATGYLLSASIEGVQLDWEAFTIPSHQKFIQDVRKHLKVIPLSQDSEGTSFNDLPEISKNVTTLREMIHILNPKEY